MFQDAIYEKQTSIYARNQQIPFNMPLQLPNNGFNKSTKKKTDYNNRQSKDRIKVIKCCISKSYFRFQYIETTWRYIETAWRYIETAW